MKPGLLMLALLLAACAQQRANVPSAASVSQTSTSVSPTEDVPPTSKESIRLPVTAVPSTGLADGEAVTVGASGFLASENAGVVECQVEAVTEHGGSNDCDLGRVLATFADQSGAMTVTAAVSRHIRVKGLDTDCADRAGRCVIAVGAVTDYSRSGFVSVSFDAARAPIVTSPVRTGSGPDRPPPIGTGAELNVAYPYRIHTHCGVVAMYFDGRFWDAQPPLRDGSGNPPAGWDRNDQAGTVTLLSRDRAEFVAPAGLRAEFVPHVPPQENPQPVCE